MSHMRLLLLLPLLSAGCSGGITGPLPSADQVVYSSHTGRQTVSFRFTNRTGALLTTPAIHTSCGCHDVEWTPSVLQPGDTAELKIHQDSVFFPIRGEANIQWDGLEPLRMRWTVAKADGPSISIAPSTVQVGLLEDTSSCEFSFVTDTRITTGSIPPELSIVDDLVGAQIKMLSCEPDGPGRYQGRFSIDFRQLPASKTLIRICAAHCGTSTILIQ